MQPTEEQIQQVLNRIEDRPPGISREQFREVAPLLASFDPFRGAVIESVEAWTDNGNGETHLLFFTSRGGFGFVSKELKYSCTPVSEERAREISRLTKDDVNRILDNAVYG
jgi:hypothetical protein